MLKLTIGLFVWAQQKQKQGGEYAGFIANWDVPEEALGEHKGPFTTDNHWDFPTVEHFFSLEKLEEQSQIKMSEENISEQVSKMNDANSQNQIRTMAETRWYLHGIAKGTQMGNYQNIDWDM